MVAWRTADDEGSATPADGVHELVDGEHGGPTEVLCGSERMRTQRRVGVEQLVRSVEVGIPGGLSRHMNAAVVQTGILEIERGRRRWRIRRVNLWRNDITCG